jgi:hypothetical protein
MSKRVIAMRLGTADTHSDGRGQLFDDDGDESCVRCTHRGRHRLRREERVTLRVQG